MKIVALSGSIIGTRTRTAMDYVVEEFRRSFPKVEVELRDLSDHDLPFSDGRQYIEYEGDAADLTEAIMEADALVIGTPVFQASIPGTLKNVFDLLPEKAFLDKVVSIVVTAGSQKHYLIAEQQLKPILSYMKAQVVQSYVFIEEQDFYRNEIISDDILFRLARLAEDTVALTEIMQKIREARDAEYGF